MISFAVRRPISVFMLVIGLVVLGIISYQRIPMQLMPNIEIPEFTVVTSWKGASATEVELQVTNSLERSFSTLPGLKENSSTSEKEVSYINLKFNSKVSILDTIALIKDRIDSSSLPEGISKPRVVRAGDFNRPLLTLAVQAVNPLINQADFQEELEADFKKGLENLDGIALVTIKGSPEKIFKIEILANAIQSYGFSVSQVVEAIHAQSKVIPVGSIDHQGKTFTIKMGSAITNVSKLEQVVIRKENSKTLRIKDVAKVILMEKEKDFSVRVNGQESLLVQVRKESDANAVHVSEKVNQFIQNFLEKNTDLYKINVVENQGQEIKAAVENVESSVVNGAWMAAFVVFLLIQTLWPTFVVSIAIPMSLTLTLVLMYFYGVSFNLMSLAGLALGVGMLVDNSTVVLESIHAQMLLTKDKAEAALFGTKKVASAIVASTFSTVAVFAPLALIEGSLGLVFRDVALTVSFSILSSLVVALVLIPTLSLYEGRFSNGVQTAEFPKFRTTSLQFHVYLWEKIRFVKLVLSWFLIGQLLTYVFKRMDVLVRPLLLSVQNFFFKLEKFLDLNIPLFIANRKKWLQIGLISTVSGFVFLSNTGAELFPDESGSTLVYELQFPVNQSFKKNLELSVRIESNIRKIVGVKNTFMINGESAPYVTQILVQTDSSLTSISQQKVDNLLRRQPDLKYNKHKKALIGEGKPISIEVYSEDLDLLAKQSIQVERQLRNLSYLTDVENLSKPIVPEMRIDLQADKMSLLTIDSSAFVNLIRGELIGQSGIDLVSDGRNYKTWIQSKGVKTTDQRSIASIGIESEDFKKIYLSQIANIQIQGTQSQIFHKDRKRVNYVNSDLNNMDLSSAVTSLKDLLEIKLPDVKYLFGGQQAERDQTTRSMIIAILSSIVLIYLLLASQYENLIQPLIVLVAVPLCVSGVAISLLLFGLNVSVFVFVGCIILVGSSVNTSIVLVDFANQLHAEGVGVIEAITKATKLRMRPIFVTTAANILGLLPMVMAVGQSGGAMQRSLGVTMIGGLLSSTVLTVLIIPAVYYVLTKKESA